MGDGHLAQREKKWCGHFSANIIGQFSDFNMYLRYEYLALFTCTTMSK